MFQRLQAQNNTNSTHSVGEQNSVDIDHEAQAEVEGETPKKFRGLSSFFVIFDTIEFQIF